MSMNSKQNENTNENANGHKTQDMVTIQDVRISEVSNDTQSSRDPFTRKFSLPRTPPRGRTYSMPDIEITPKEKPEGNINKRKRVEDVPLDKCKPQEDFGELLENALSIIFGQAMLLGEEVKKCYKPKKEIVSVSNKLNLELGKIRTEAFDEWLKKIIRKETDSEDALYIENAKLRRQIRSMEEEKIREKEYIEKLEEESANLANKISDMEETISMMTEVFNPSDEKCNECQKAQKLKSRRAQLKRSESYESFQNIPEEDWALEVFPKLNTVTGYIWDAPTEWDVILPCDKDFESDHADVRRCIDKFGGKEGLKRQNKMEGEVAMMLHALGFPDKGGNFNQVSRCIYYPILGDKNGKADNYDSTLFEALLKVKASLMEGKRNKLAILEMDDVRGLILIRMLQFLLSDTPVEMLIYKPPHSLEGQRKRRLSTNNGFTRDKSKGPRNNKKQDALLISMAGKSYADLVKTIKTAVSPNELGVEVQNMKKTRKGDLVLTIQNGADKAEVLKKELKDRVPEATTSLLVRQKILHLKGLDETVSEEEIREAISRMLGIERDKFEVRALRPAYGGKQNATLKMMEKDASNLLKATTIRIGWTKCRIIERDNTSRCTKCWEQGHGGRACKGPDRSLLCLKCGKDGHKILECPNEPFCLNCERAGHRTGSKLCPGKLGEKRTADPSTTSTNNA